LEEVSLLRGLSTLCNLAKYEKEGMK